MPPLSAGEERQERALLFPAWLYPRLRRSDAGACFDAPKLYHCADSTGAGVVCISSNGITLRHCRRFTCLRRDWDRAFLHRAPEFPTIEAVAGRAATLNYRVIFALEIVVLQKFLELLEISN